MLLRCYPGVVMTKDHRPCMQRLTVNHSRSHLFCDRFLKARFSGADAGDEGKIVLPFQRFSCNLRMNLPV